MIGYGLQDLISVSGRKRMDAASQRHVKIRSLPHVILFQRVMALYSGWGIERLQHDSGHLSALDARGIPTVTVEPVDI